MRSVKCYMKSEESGYKYMGFLTGKVFSVSCSPWLDGKLLLTYGDSLGRIRQLKGASLIQFRQIVARNFNRALMSI